MEQMKRGWEEEWREYEYRHLNRAEFEKRFTPPNNSTNEKINRLIKAEEPVTVFQDAPIEKTNAKEA